MKGVPHNGLEDLHTGFSEERCLLFMSRVFSQTEVKQGLMESWSPAKFHWHFSGPEGQKKLVIVMQVM